MKTSPQRTREKDAKHSDASRVLEMSSSDHQSMTPTIGDVRNASWRRYANDRLRHFSTGR